MSVEMHVSDDGQYIIMKVTGDINREIALEQNLQAHALGAKLGISRYLVDLVEARNTDRVVDQHDFAYKDMGETEGIDRRAIVALLVAEEDHSHDFIQIVARNSGLNVTIFHDRKAAISFLLDE